MQKTSPCFPSRKRQDKQRALLKKGGGIRLAFNNLSFFFDLKITVLKVCCTDALQSLAQTQILRQALQQLLQCDVTSPGAAMAMEKF